MNTNIQEANKRFEAKKREEILAAVPAEFHTKVIKALDEEKAEEYDKAVATCQEMLKQGNAKELEQVRIILARVYPRLLRMDVEQSNQKYQADLAKYYEFLDSIPMNDLMQEYVVETMIRLCELMGNDWYRPLFKEFAQHIEAKGYLTNEEYKNTLASAYASMESYSYFDDAKLSMIVKVALKAAYDREYTMKDEQVMGSVNTMKIDDLTNQFYLCKYYEAHQEEFVYLEETYPHSYQLAKALVQEVKSDAKKKSDKVLEELMTYVTAGTTKEQLETLLNKSYEEVLVQEQKPRKVAEGKVTYQRPTEKIGRNDLCPCGSGKKYKYCCGK